MAEEEPKISPEDAAWHAEIDAPKDSLSIEEYIQNSGIRIGAVVRIPHPT